MKSRFRLVKTFLTVTLVLLPGCRPVEEEEESPGPSDVAVEVGKVIRTTLQAYVDAYGQVTPAPTGAAFPTAPVAGLVLDVPVSEGQMVRAGDLLVRLDDRIALAEVERAQATVSFSEQTLNRQKTLLEQNNTSRVQFEQAQQALALARAELTAAEGALAQMQLRSPLAGVVSRINVFPGQSVDLNTVVAEIVDLRRIVASVNVPADQAGRVKIGQTARLLTPSGRETDVTASVSFVSPSVDPKTATVLVRLEPQPDAELSPGQFVSVRIVVDEHAGCLAVPRESVYITDDGHGELSVVEEDTANRKVVRVGLQDGGLIEVEGADLQEGMTVVTVGAYTLPESAKVSLKGDRP